MVAFAFGEVLLSPSLPAIVNDLAPDSLRGRYNGVYVLAWTTGFAVGPAIGGLALADGLSTPLFLGLIGACGVAAVAALRLGARVPAELNLVSGLTVEILQVPKGDRAPAQVAHTKGRNAIDVSSRLDRCSVRNRLGEVTK